MAINYYDVLDINKNSSKQQIRSAYRKQILLWHINKNRKNDINSIKRFTRIDTAYKILSNPNLKHKYDLTLSIKNEEKVNYTRFVGNLFYDQSVNGMIKKMINRMDLHDKKSVLYLVYNIYEDKNKFIMDLEDKRYDKMINKTVKYLNSINLYKLLIIIKKLVYRC